MAGSSPPVRRIAGRIPDLPPLPAVEPVLPDAVADHRAHRRARRARERRVAKLILLLAAASALSLAARRAGARPEELLDAGRSAIESAAGRMAFGAPASADAVASLTSRLVTLRSGFTAPTPEPTREPTVVLPTPIAAVQVGGAEKLPGLLRPLTSDGCCADAWWSSDARHVLYLDRPGDDPAAAIFEVPVWPPGSAPVAADLEVARRAGSERFVVRPAGGASIVEDIETGDEWTVETGGRPARISADGRRLVWWDARGDRGHYDAAVAIHTASLDGGDAQELATMWGSSVFDFLPDGRTVVVSGRPDRQSPVFVLAKLDTVTGQLTELARGAWLSDAAVAPSGEWIAYMVSLDRAAPESNGLWIVAAGGGAPTKLPFIGAYRWRDGQRLVYVPMVLDAAADEVWEYDPHTGASVRLIGAETGLRIANNDWSVSPDGGAILFRAAADLNLWVVDLPE